MLNATEYSDMDGGHLWTLAFGHKRNRTHTPKASKTTKTDAKRLVFPGTHLAKQMDLFVPDIKRYLTAKLEERRQHFIADHTVRSGGCDGQDVVQRPRSSATTVVSHVNRRARAFSRIGRGCRQLARNDQ